MNRAIIGLGSNIKPIQNLEKAKEIFSYRYRIISNSCLRLTKPISKVEQNDFVNVAILIETELSMKKLKIELSIIESILGRAEQHDTFGPRIIDLDIVVWNEKIIDQDFHERNYLKQSVLELIPDLKY